MNILATLSRRSENNPDEQLKTDAINGLNAIESLIAQRDEAERRATHWEREYRQLALEVDHYKQTAFNAEQQRDYALQQNGEVMGQVRSMYHIIYRLMKEVVVPAQQTVGQIAQQFAPQPQQSEENQE